MRSMAEESNETSELENCPQCRAKLPPRLSTGRVVCSKCGWTDQPRSTSSRGIDQGEDNASKISMNKSASSIHKFWVSFKQYNAVIGAASLMGIFVLMLFNSLLGHKIQWEYRRVEFLAETSASAFTSNEKDLSFKTIPDISLRVSTLGQEGWELTGTYLEHETAHPNFGKSEYVTGIQSNFRPQKLVLIFKRQKKLF